MRGNLKKARQEAGMTQQQVADHLDIGLRYYQKIHAGGYKWKYIDNFES